MMKRALTILVALAFCVPFLWRCANILSLEGGPRDSIPPRIVAVEPLDYSTNFTAKSIFIEFDEFVTLKDQQKEFFTSPRMKKTPQLTIRGRGVVIKIQDTLRENTTYALNFGSTICDNNEGNPYNGLRYVFSSGPQIDSMVVSGYTEDAFKADSVSKSFVYFFPVDELDSVALTRDYDSVMLRKDTMGVLVYNPAVIARAEKNGIFIAQNLKPIPYRIYAFEDTNSNMMYEASIDKIGFIDEPQNPIELHDFGVWYDSMRMYVTAQPQLYFRMFTDETFRMQNLREMSRPRQHQAQLIFNAPIPQIDSLVFDSLPRERILIESLSRQRDTLALWFDAPGAELPDTLKGRIVYRQWNDSLKSLIPASRDLRLAWRAAPETREQERERKKLEEEREAALRDSTEWVEPEKPTRFKHTLAPQGGTVTPETELYITFDMPLSTMDTTRIVMREIMAVDTRGNKIEKPDTVQIPVRWHRDLSFDSMQTRRWRLDVAWRERANYQLLLPKGTFEDIAREKNDSTTVGFTGIDPDKTSTFVVNVVGKTPDARYIVQLLDANGRVLQEKTNVGTEKITFRYVSPGDVKFRATEDTNANGRWDTGSLVERRQPERTEYYIDPKTGEDVFVAKENWHFDDIQMDMNVVFAPLTVERLWETLDQRERARLEKLAEDRAKQR